MKPMIVVIPQLFPGSDNILTRPGYMTEVQVAGGMPLLAPPTEKDEDILQLIEMADGLLVPGGQDVDPAMYGEERLPECGEPQGWRDRMEQKAILKALELNKPIFAICRGFQILNVVLGGDLYQDIPTQYDTTIEHSMPQPSDRLWHEVNVVPDSPLYDLLGQDSFAVNSCHHQAVRRLGKGLTVMATAPDGITEAYWMPDKPFVWGVQWHPERLGETEQNHRKLFEAFIEACRK